MRIYIYILYIYIYIHIYIYPQIGCAFSTLWHDNSFVKKQMFSFIGFRLSLWVLCSSGIIQSSYKLNHFGHCYILPPLRGRDRAAGAGEDHLVFWQCFHHAMMLSMLALMLFTRHAIRDILSTSSLLNCIEHTPITPSSLFNSKPERASRSPC